ncbi:uncharacterized protein TRIADDRAFT_54568 [Trichoplax adhaerens]|uniref:Uncharacterized protein n=1 Tax=Trichoplax adhaerens TaxID=10228 RepID=B3RSE5_TRIAD|nr:hypothetical protein TRIADDRAFT_54568 [Trichoplax adhaerens]EDV27041.1 hypothetical protein TRIADDRAFT_54568 [Trichoplax adhaerens]|eukprot:XP_002111037.1 hypothetical protein TRIADDRAFT_54568 [Trichoplax adhaerens]
MDINQEGKTSPDDYDFVDVTSRMTSGVVTQEFTNPTSMDVNSDLISLRRDTDFKLADADGLEYNRTPQKMRENDSIRKYWEESPEVYGIRRSGRERKEPTRLHIGNTSDSESVTRTKRKKSNNGNSHRGMKRKARSGKRSSSKSKGDSVSDEAYRASRISQRRAAANVSYKEESENDSTGSDELLNIQDKSNLSGTVVDEEYDTIEKILKHRVGRIGDTGANTTWYALKDRDHTPTEANPTDDDQTEIQYLVKFKDWANIHNTWESERSLKEQNVRGLKKLNNYIKREKEIDEWKQMVSPEDLEYFECQRQMIDELFSQYTQVERVIACRLIKQMTGGSTADYLVKWQGLPYADCTWEDGDLINRHFPNTIQAYYKRQENIKIPDKNCKVLRNRPKFVLLKSQPDYVGNSTHQLRDYQLDSLNWMIHAWCKENSIILADEMGLGKTIQVISFLSYLYHSHSLYGIFLLVVPLSTMTSWQREFELWAPDINVVVYLGDTKSRRMIRDYDWYNSNKRFKFNALLTTYEIVLKDKDILKSFKWACLAVDEAHRLKNDDSLLYRYLMEFKTDHRLLITGTPLQNSLKELWSLLHFIMEKRYDSWEKFKDSFMKDDGSSYMSLHQELQPYILRRVKKDVEKSLPAKVEQILRVEMTAIQKQYYRWIITRNYKALSKGAKGSLGGFINIMMELKKCCNHASLVKMEEKNNKDAIQSLLRGSGKMILLDKLLCRLKETGHRVLIFSQMVRMLDILAEYLQIKHFLFQRLDGSIRGDLRKQALDHFNADGSQDFCFLLSTRAGGLGLNLASADTVIIFDSDWNPQNDIQAQSRAHRIGQRKQNSVEEEIIERATKKMVLDHLVIQRMDTSGRTVLSKSSAPSSANFTKEEVDVILKFGVEELFKETDGEQDKKLQEMDLDEILQRAETQSIESTKNTPGMDLLSSFKVASFAMEEELPIDEDEKQSARDWSDIVPSDEIKKIEEEEQQREILKTILKPRNRKPINQLQLRFGGGALLESSDSNSDSEKRRGHNRRYKKRANHSDDTDSEADVGHEKGSKKKRGRPRSAVRDLVFGLTNTELRRFLRSYKKFGHPLGRIESIAIDAELQDKSMSDLANLAKSLQEKCSEAVRDFEEKASVDTSETKEAVSEGASADNKLESGKHDIEGKKKGAIVRLGGVSVNALAIVRHQNELEPLSKWIPSSNEEQKKFELPCLVKAVHWDLSWDSHDDAMLLVGIFRHGIGNWESIKEDPELGLSDKILQSGNSKPQGKHLQTRTEYLLKLLKHSERNKTVVIAPRPKKPKFKKRKELNDKADMTKTEGDPKNTKTFKSHGASNVRRNKKPKLDIASDGYENVKIENSVTGSKEKTKLKKKAAKNETGSKIEQQPKEYKEKKKVKKKKMAGTDSILDNGNTKSLSNDKKLTNLKISPKKRVKHTSALEKSAEDNASLPTLKLDNEAFVACKEKMRPVKRALKVLEQPMEDMPQEQQVSQTKECLLQIGDHISTVCHEFDANATKLWKSNLWIFVSNFTSFEAKQLHKVYKQAVKERETMKNRSYKEEIVGASRKASSR